MKNCSELIINDISAYCTDIKGVFDNDRPLHLEIGCGKGGFIAKTAELNPDINFIAFEKNLDVLVLAMEKVKALNLKNVRFVPGDAEALGNLETAPRSTAYT